MIEVAYLVQPMQKSALLHKLHNLDEMVLVVK